MYKLRLLFKLIYFSFLLMVIAISIIFGSTMAQAIDGSIAQNPNNRNLELSKQFYLENCSSCHVPIPAEVLPTTSWEKILKNPKDHYGQSLPQINRINIRLIWNYLRENSRSLLVGEKTPQYVTNSRYFKALHPQVDLPKPAGNQTCLSCHPGAQQLDYLSINEQ